MTKFIPFFKLYSTYVKDCRRSMTALKQTVAKKKAFKEFLQLEVSDFPTQTRCNCTFGFLQTQRSTVWYLQEAVSGFQLQSLLLAPIERLPQYLQYLATVSSSRSARTAAASCLGGLFANDGLYTEFSSPPTGLDPASQAAITLHGAVMKIQEATDDIATAQRDQVRWVEPRRKWPGFDAERWRGTDA